MAEELVTDRRLITRKGVIRAQVWVDTKTRVVTRYSYAYINHDLMSGDQGRVVGFDDAHLYPGFSSKHHMHWYGVVYENTLYATQKKAEERFERFLLRLKQQHGKNY